MRSAGSKGRRRPLRDGHAVLARCVCVLTKRPLLLDLHVAVLRDALGAAVGEVDLYGHAERARCPSFVIRREKRKRKPRRICVCEMLGEFLFCMDLVSEFRMSLPHLMRKDGMRCFC